MPQFPSVIELFSLDASVGVQINGEASEDDSGSLVSSAGDINGDGFDDIIVAAPGGGTEGYYIPSSGATYVVFGTASGFSTALELSTLDGTNGFQITGEPYEWIGHSVSSAGDVNGDGFDDIIIGANTADPNGQSSGASYVVYGKATGFAADLELSTINGTNGFQINGETAGDGSGFSVSSAGDVNGDGFDDIIIGASGADPNGGYSGASYVVFGRTSGFGTTFELSSLNGTNGFQINGEALGSRSGSSVSSAGDVNGDGFDDIIVGAPAGLGTTLCSAKQRASPPISNCPALTAQTGSRSTANRNSTRVASPSTAPATSTAMVSTI
jgi:hypothetical protein